MRNFTIDRSDTWTSRTRRKLKLLAFWMTAFFIQIGFGQTGTIQIGSGNVTTTADQRIPVSNYVYNYNQQIVTAAEYAAGGGAVGDITKIRYMATSVGTITVWNQWTVYIGHTTKTEFTSTTDWVPLSELTQVFSGTLTPNPVANEWFEIEFTVPFSYTGGNLVVAIHEYAPGWTSAPNFLSYTSTANSGIMYRNDSTNPNPASPPTATYRISNLPQIQFEGVLAPACPAPNAVTSLNLTIDGTTVAGTITPNGASSGYLVLRSTDAVLSDMPEAGSSYAVGSTLGNGIIVHNNTGTSFSDTTASGNTQYYYHAFAYNNNPGTCLINYSTTSLTEDITTCPGTPIVVGASNVRTNGAILNWTSALYADNTGVTYTVNISTSADFNTLFDSDSGLVGTSYTLTGLIANTTYYWRVKAVGSSCDSDWAGGSFVAQSSYSPIAVTGFTADVIADGIGGALNSTTDPVDSTNPAANNAYVSNSFKLNPSSNSITNGLPLNRKINSPNITGLSFILPDYAGNNSLRLPEQNVPGTLMFTEPLKLTDIYFAFTSGDGSCTVTAEILFDDDTNQIIEGIAFTNWDSTPPASAPAIVGNLPRVKRDLTSNSSGTNFKIFQYGLPIDEANQNKNVIGVKFTKTSTGTLSPVANIFAVSGKIIGDCPILGTTTVEDLEATSAELNWTLSNAGTGSLPADVTYTVQLYSDAGHTMPVGDPIIVAGVTEHNITNLNTLTTYHYTIVGNNGTCDSAMLSGQFTTPPVNDNCSGAIALIVNPDMACANVTSGTTLGATQSMAATPCFGNPDDDVWFSFEATNVKHFISISNIVILTGTSTDMYFQVLSGSCDSTSSLLCSDPNDNSVSGLTVGETYFIRVWSYGNTSRNSFNICIKTPPPPATNDDCGSAIALTVNDDLSCGITTMGTTLGATQSMAATPCFGNPDDDVWFSFEATNAKHRISISNIVALEGTATDMYFQVLSGACDSTTSIFCSDPESNLITGLTPGETYFIRVWSYGSTSRQSFSICVGTPPPPPINDVCSEAFELIAGNNFNISAIPTTNNSATADSGEPVPGCDNFNFATNGGDVWYTVVVPPLGSITLETRGDGSNSITDTGIAAYSGSCDSLTSLGCNADDGDGNFSLLSLSGLNPGDIILVRAWGYNGAQGTFQIAAYHNSIPLPCPEPTDFTSGEITTDSVELSWTGTADSFTIEYGPAGFTPGTGTAVTEISSPFTLSGLDDNTEYDVYLKGICTANESDWVGPVNFTTLEEVSNPPACDISVSISSPNWGDVITWQLIDGNGDTVLSGGTYPQEGYSDTQTYIAINPPYTLQINHDPNTFFCDNDLDYLVTVGGNIDISGTIFDPCSGGQANIPLTTDFTACIPSCSAPTALTHTQLSMSSAELFWTSDGDLFEVKWGETGFDVETEGTLVDNLEATTLTLEELIIDTQYQFYVRQDCTETNDGYSTWAGPYSFTVGYCTMAAPMYYDSTGITQVTFGEINNPSNTGLSGISNIYYNNYTDISTDVIAGETYDLSVNVNTSGNWMVWASAWIDWNNDGVFDTNLATNGGEAYNLGSVQNVTNGATNGSPHSITIPNVEPGEYRMRIKAVYGTAAIPSPCESQDFSETEDYTIIVMADSCPEPTNFASGEITTDSVELSWTGTSDSFTIEYGSAGYTPGTGTAVAGVSSPFTLSGLDDNTEYDVYVKAVCNASESDWVGPVNVTTLEDTSTPTPVCDLTVNISGTGWGDEVTWQLLDANNAVALSGGPYGNGFNHTQTISATNPPYTLVINRDGTFCDNALNYTVTLGGEVDITGTLPGACNTMSFNIGNCPSCPLPSNLGIANATSTSVDLTWNASSSNADIEWGPTGFTPGTGTMVTGVTSPYTVSSSIGVYQFYVRQNCGGGDISDWAGPYSFTIGGYQGGNISSRYNTNPTVNSTDFCTPEPTITIEVPEGMQIASLQVLYSMRAATAAESGAIADAYMSEQRSFIYSPTLSAGETSLAQGTGFNAGNFNYNRTLTFANGATGSVDFVLRSWRTWEGIAGCNATVNYVVNGTWVIIPTFEQIPPCPEPSNPMLNITGNTVQLSWDGTGTFDIAYGVAPFTPTTPTETDVTSPYTFSNLENNTLYMAYIRTNCTINESAWVGPFYFSVVEPCNIPISINLYDITDSSATVGWVSDGTSFDIEYGLAGFTPTGTATDSDIDNPFTISDLTPATEYDIYIRRNCGALESDWIGPFSFTTLCDVAMPMGDNAQELQLGDSLNNLIITGDNLTWYADENLTEEIDPSTILEAGTYTFLVTASNDNCESSAFLVVVTVIDPCAGVLTPIGDAMQSILEGGTLADLVVEGENLVWYADEDLTQPLDPSTVVENEVTYYVVSETEECQSEALTITVQTLDRTDFTQFAFNFYPNPVNDILNLTSNSEISKISMFNMLGQQVTIPTNVNNTQVDMSGLPTGNYIITITIEGLTKTFKVVKK